MVIDKPVRSGQSIYFPDGDITVLGSVSSGAEVIAGGSIHVYGALRGRAVAGATGDGNARIVCRRYHAELSRSTAITWRPKRARRSSSASRCISACRADR